MATLLHSTAIIAHCWKISNGIFYTENVLKYNSLCAIIAISSERTYSNMKIALYTPPFTNMTSYYEMVDVAKKYGIKYMETITLMELSDPDVEFAKKLYEYASERGIAFSCVSVYANVSIESFDADVTRLKGFVDVAKALHSPYIHHTIVPEYESFANISDNLDALYENGVKAVKEISSYAKSQGITALYEPQGYLFNGVKTLEKLTSEVKDVGLVGDFGNVFFVDERITPILKAFPDKIKNVHLKDYLVVESASECCTSKFGTHFIDRPLGCGEVDFEEAFTALREIGYDGCVALEAACCSENEEEEFVANLEFMKKLGCEL